MGNNKKIKGTGMKFFGNLLRSPDKAPKNGWYLTVDKPNPIYEIDKVFEFFEDGEQKRSDGPCVICVFSDGSQTTIKMDYLKDGKYHREDGPARIYIKGDFLVSDIPSSILKEESFPDFLKWVYSTEKPLVEFAYYLDGKNFYPKEHKRVLIQNKLKAL